MCLCIFWREKSGQFQKFSLYEQLVEASGG